MNSERKKILLLMAKLAGIITVVIAGLALTGWVLDIAILKSISPEWVSMKANTSICFLLAGLCLILLNSEKPTTTSKVMAPVLAVILLGTGTLTLLEYIFDSNTGFDEFFFHDNTAAINTSYPGRPSAVTAVCFMLLGSSLLSFRFLTHKPFIFQLQSLMVGFIAFVSLTGYLFGANHLVTFFGISAMAFHAAICFLLIALAVLFSNPEAGIMKHINSNTMGGKLFRNTFPVVALLIILLGKLRFMSELAVIFDTEFGIATIVVFIIFSFGIILFIYASAMSKVETSLRQSESHLRSIFENTSKGFLLVDTDQTIIELNNPINIFAAQAYGGHLVKGENLTTSLPEDRREIIKARFNKILAGERLTYESLYHKPDGKTVSFYVELSPVVDQGHVVGACFSVENITERKKAEEQLTEFKHFFNNSNDLSCIANVNGYFEILNPNFEKLLGYTIDELTSNSFLNFIHPDDIDATLQEVEKLTTGALTINFVNRYRKKDGSYLWFDWNTTPNTSNGKLYAIARDITGRKRAEEQKALLEAELKENEKRFRDLIESLPQLFWTCRADGSCNYLSKQWLEYTCIPEADQLGNGWLEQIHPEDKDRTIAEWTVKVKTQKSFDMEYRIRKSNGEYKWFKARAVPMFDLQGNLLKWFGSNTDVDDLKKVEEEIRQLNLGLEQKVKERTGQLEMVNKELEAFTFSVSHDLRAPLRAVSSYSQILVDDYTGKLDDDGKQILENIIYNNNKMGVLIDELLSFSRLGRKELDKKPVNMNELANEVLTNINRTVPHHAQITVGPLPEVEGEYSLISQVLYNLISNAIKYSSKKAHPRVEMFAEERNGIKVFVVRDNGAGFDMRFANKLFGVFQRLHSEQEFEGNGEGLAIVHRIIAKHGGAIWGEGKENEGATFYFTLN